MFRSKTLFTILLALAVTVLTAPQAWAACELCKGHFTNRSCQSDSEGHEGCQNNYTGQCINGTGTCSGASCGTGTGCEEEHQSRLDWEIPTDGEVLPAPLPACESAGVVIEA